MKMTLSINWWRMFVLVLLFSGCKAYKQDIMFKLDSDMSGADLATSISQAEQNYRLQADDYIQVDVFTNSGERIVDPNFELSQNLNNQAAQSRKDFQYLIQTDGTAKLPLVGKKKLSGLSIDEAESILEQSYDSHYKESFVKIKIMNRRVVVLGANGGQVIQIANENTSLVEVLALYGGLNMGAKAHNIKLIRGDLASPEVFQIDLGTVAGMKNSIVEVESGDVIYVEPWRRPWIESIRDIAPVLSVTSSILTLIVVIQNLK